MPSMLERISKNLVKEIGSKDLTPVKYLLSATKLRQFVILRKKKDSRSSFWEQSDYVPVEFSLNDILEPSSSVLETVVTGPFHFSDIMIQKHKADMGVNVGIEVSVSGEASVDHGCSLEFQIVTIPSPNLEDFQKRKLLDPEPSFLKECRRRGDNLYVVTEAVELINNTVLYDSSSVNILGKIALWITYGKGQGQGESLRVKKKALTLQKGMVMAYKRKQLVIKEKAILISDDDEQRTFQDEYEISEMVGYCAARSEGLLPSFHTISPTLFNASSNDMKLKPELFLTQQFLSGHLPKYEQVHILPVGRIEEPFWQNFKHLQEEVFQKIKTLAQLSKDVQDVMFYSILAMLRDRGALQDLMNMLELDSSGHLDGPGGAILKKLQQDSNHAWFNPKDPILYLLEAIMVLSDFQHDLLACSMEKRILLQQQELGMTSMLLLVRWIPKLLLLLLSCMAPGYWGRSLLFLILKAGL
ncbi:gasdermin-C isoform X3 [Homo sapiens]|uniref:gasdermin-C isoform X3 n=1 Tax=Homo sapiens TaxID=9606 RepID=UPI0005D0220C|nr:gasdermin-C isoform X3 [Homo sapiens]XP_054188371.1 gasdermin-C isoform X3 [Homo sapiens]XP_054216823.1 gasdermin-C isoform X3 [Homo sapiens]|eukprot:XP_011515463.1 gasdermin-C isoform X3 [Homo sapiens]